MVGLYRGGPPYGAGSRVLKTGWRPAAPPASARRAGCMGRALLRALACTCGVLPLASAQTDSGDDTPRAKAPHSAAVATAVRSPGIEETRARWAFEPLGPEGAPIRDLLALANGRWVARSQAGELFLREPAQAALAGGIWEELKLPGTPDPTTVLRIGTDPAREALLILSADGRLYSWVPGGGMTNRETLTERRRMGPADASTDASAGPRSAGRIPAQAASRAIALLRNAPDAVTVVLDDATVWRIRGGTAESWRARFVIRKGRRANDTPAEWSGTRGEERDLERPILRSIQVCPGASAIYLAVLEWEGLYISRDGMRTFFPVVGDLPKEVTALAIAPAEASSLQPRLYAATASGIYASDDLAATWNPTRAPEHGSDVGSSRPLVQLVAASNPAGLLFALTREGVLLRGEAAELAAEPILADLPARVYCMDDAAGEVALGTSRGVLVSGDGAQSWAWCNRGLHRVDVLEIEVGASDPRNILLTTDVGGFLSRDAGRTWSPAQLEPAAESPGASSKSQPEAPSGAVSGIWTAAEQEILEISPPTPAGLHWLVVHTPDGVFAACEDDAGAVSLETPDGSRAGSEIWEAVPLPDGVRVTCVAGDAAHGRILLGTARYGLFAVRLPVEPPAGEPTWTVLAMPNPFRRSVVLRCPLRGAASAMQAEPAPGGGVDPGDAELQVFTIGGQLVRRLLRPEWITGAGGELSLQWGWDGSDERGQEVASGLYLVSVRVGTQRALGRIIKMH